MHWTDSTCNTAHLLITTNGVLITSTKKLISKNFQGLEKKVLTSKMRNGRILPQIANIVCTQCHATYKNRKLAKLLTKINFRKSLHLKSIS